jgi:AcrR family transcriptional regulator
MTSSHRPRSERTVPIYKRLPHGPHRLAPKDVARNQQARLHGAMIEAVARNGYAGTSVKEVIALAGVSRRSFYELFANKQECFLATFDVVAARELRRASDACAAAGKIPEDRLAAALAGCERSVRTERKSLSLMLLDAPAAGSAGNVRLCRASAALERLLDGCLQRGWGAGPLPAPLLRGVSGALQWSLAQELRQPQEGKVSLADELLRFTLSFAEGPGAAVAERMAVRLRRRVGTLSTAAPQPTASAADAPSRLLESALRLACGPDRSELTAARLCDGGRVAIELFFELFESAEQCRMAAFEMVGREALGAVGDRELDGEEWSRAVHARCERLLGYLAARPLHAVALVSGAFAAGEDTLERHLQLCESLGAALLRGAPATVCTGSASAALGALFQLVCSQLASGRAGLLGALGDHLGYVLLAPALGARAAGEAIVGAGRAAAG